MSLLVVVSLALLSLTFADSTSAEGAWALWERTVSMAARMDEWRVVEVFDERGPCQGHLRFYVDGRVRVERTAGTRIISTHPDAFTIVIGVIDATHSFQCLPDTIDPRGPKR